MRSENPVLRLRDFSVGASVRLKDDQLKRKLVISAIRSGHPLPGFYDLSNNGKVVVTASPCHEVEK